jgi:hypothetical protein
MHQQVKHSTSVRSANTILLCCVLSDLCHLQHKLIGFYNRDEKCLQRGTDWPLNKAACAQSLKG